VKLFLNFPTYNHDTSKPRTDGRAEKTAVLLYSKRRNRWLWCRLKT